MVGVAGFAGGFLGHWICLDFSVAGRFCVLALCTQITNCWQQVF
jgi:hypothetical protein